jgi:hypothetical protein
MPLVTRRIEGDDALISAGPRTSARWVRAYGVTSSRRRTRRLPRSPGKSSPLIMNLQLSEPGSGLYFVWFSPGDGCRPA